MFNQIVMDGGKYEKMRSLICEKLGITRLGKHFNYEIGLNGIKHPARITLTFKSKNDRDAFYQTYKREIEEPEIIHQEICERNFQDIIESLTLEQCEMFEKMFADGDAPNAKPETVLKVQNRKKELLQKEKG